MKVVITVTTLFFIFNSCTPLVEGYIRNMSGSVVNIYGTIIDRWDFKKLPNLVTFYEMPVKPKRICGKWKGENLLTWADSTHFRLQIPDSTVVDMSELSKELVLGIHLPRIQLVISSENTSDTLMTGNGNYEHFILKFKSTKGLLPTYYHDIR